MTQLMPFSYEDKNIRIVMKDNEPWWVLKDVCNVLTLSDTNKVAERLDDDELTRIKLVSGGQTREMHAVNESGLYNVILRSDKPQAKAFRRWVTHEVLPEIRKTGGYALPKTLPDALRLAADLAEENEKLKPKADMHDTFLSAENAQPMNVVAKSLGTGRNRLFEFLRAVKILMPDNTPYQRYIEAEHFKVIEKPVPMQGKYVNKPVTLVTPKGMDYIAKLFKEHRYINTPIGG